MEYQRFTARKVLIADLHSGTYKQNESSVNFIELEDGSTVSRVNIVGIVVGVDDSLWVDDGSGSIAVRSFDNSNQDVEVGSCVLVIGRPREFEGQKYVIGEILRSVDSRWLDVRKKEISSVEKIVVREEVTQSLNVVDVVRSLDEGDGADYEEVLSKVGDEDKIIHLLAVGELFETKPGRLKVLE